MTQAEFFKFLNFFSLVLAIVAVGSLFLVKRRGTRTYCLIVAELFLGAAIYAYTQGTSMAIVTSLGVVAFLGLCADAALGMKARAK
ncbi:MAG: hypothetical protein JST35_06860 [Armatimonadetes bacterium]|nr:hypothetical protein [Armatimonadota bacterium]